MAQKPPKNSLDNLMLAYTDLSASGKGSSFKGPPLKDLKVQKVETPVFKPSANARDWTSLSQNLEDAFSVGGTNSQTYGRPPPILSPSSPTQAVNPSAANVLDMDDWGDFQAVPVGVQPQSTVPPQQPQLQSPFANQMTLPGWQCGLADPSPLSSHVNNHSSLAAVEEDDDFADFISAAPARDHTAPAQPAQLANLAPVVARPFQVGLDGQVEASRGPTSLHDQQPPILGLISSPPHTNHIPQTNKYSGSLKSNLDLLAGDDGLVSDFPVKKHHQIESSVIPQIVTKQTKVFEADKYANLRVFFDDDNDDCAASTLPLPALNATSEHVMEGQISSLQPKQQEDEFGDFIIPVSNGCNPPVIAELNTSSSLAEVNSNFMHSVMPTSYKAPSNIIPWHPDLPPSPPPLAEVGDDSLGDEFGGGGGVSGFDDDDHSCLNTFSDLALAAQKETSKAASSTVSCLSVVKSPDTLSVNSVDIGDLQRRKGSAHSLHLSEEDVTEASSAAVAEAPKHSTDTLSEDAISLSENGSSCWSEWKRALEAILRVLTEAEQSVRGINDFAVLNDIFESEQGSGYLRNLQEIHRVAARMRVSWSSDRGGRDDLEEAFAEVEKTWLSFLRYARCPNRPAKLANSESGSSRCGLCLCAVELSAGDEEDMNHASLTVESNYYHSACANLWVNLVDGVLPVVNYNVSL